MSAFCTSCGAPREKGATFCGGCGKAFDDSGAPVQATVVTGTELPVATPVQPVATPVPAVVTAVPVAPQCQPMERVHTFGTGSDNIDGCCCIKKGSKGCCFVNEYSDGCCFVGTDSQGCFCVGDHSDGMCFVDDRARGICCIGQGSEGVCCCCVQPYTPQANAPPACSV